MDHFINMWQMPNNRGRRVQRVEHFITHFRIGGVLQAVNQSFDVQLLFSQKVFFY